MSKKGDFEAVRKDIAALMHQPEYDDGKCEFLRETYKEAC
jgi:hypothetical protein